MNRRPLYVAAAFLLGVFTVGAQRSQTEGAQPYSPTRIEWLTNVAESMMGQPLNSTDKFSLCGALDRDRSLTVAARCQVAVGWGCGRGGVLEGPQINAAD